jgi:orotate phosphoribosyltransferase
VDCCCGPESPDRKELFNILKKEAFIKGKIILSSGKESDYYLDARRVTLSSAGAYYCAKLILELVAKEKFVAIGGPTLGADPLLGALNVLAFQAKKPLKTFIIRKAPKAYGRQQQIEGPEIPASGPVILVDDVATTGKAFLESLDVLDKMGVKAPKAICIIDREEGAREALARRGCELRALFSAKEFLKD